MIKKVLIAPAPFKGTLSAGQASDSISDGLKSLTEDITIKKLPLSDGGTGLADVYKGYIGGEMIPITLHGPLREIIQTRYLFNNEVRTAVMEMAAAAGYIYCKDKQEPLNATTSGVGEMILDAKNRGCKKIIVGLGDSATIDAGLGMAKALGAKFFDRKGNIVEPIPVNFDKIQSIDNKPVEKAMREIEIIGYSDVVNPSIGKKGAIRRFGQQKGMTDSDIEYFEPIFEKIISLLEATFKIKLADREMTGAAGGLGAGIIAFLNGKLKRGIDAVADRVGLEDKIKNSDIVITGEGCLDEASFSGKVVGKVLELTGKYDKALWIITGRSNVDRSYLENINVIEISPDSIPKSEKEAGQLIFKRISEEFNFRRGYE